LRENSFALVFDSFCWFEVGWLSEKLVSLFSR